jgi:hypothetical protein
MHLCDTPLLRQAALDSTRTLSQPVLRIDHPLQQIVVRIASIEAQ